MSKVFKIAVMVSLLLVSTAFAAVSELDSRIASARQVMADIMKTPDQSIPEELLAKCKAIAIYPSVVEGGFILAARFGKGVVLKRDEKTGQWGPVAFSTIGGGSWGLQIGGQATDLVLVIMNEKGLSGILTSRFELGADASIAAGPVGRHSEAATDLSLQAGIISYSRTRGVFGGISLGGAVMTQDNKSNADYYGKPVTSSDILLDNAVSVAPSSQALVKDLDEYSSRWAKRIGAKK